MAMNFSSISYQGNELEDTTKTGSGYNISIETGYQFKESLLGFQLKGSTITDNQSDIQFEVTRLSGNLYYAYFF